MKKINLLALVLMLTAASNFAVAQTNDWIQSTLDITFAEDGITAQSRVETTYDTKGRHIGSKQYYNGDLISQFRDFQYNRRTATYWYDYYSGGSLRSRVKYQTTYKDATNDSGIIGVLSNSISIYPNPT